VSEKIENPNSFVFVKNFILVSVAEPTDKTYSFKFIEKKNVVFSKTKYVLRSE
jgi:hypothetical protein